MQKFKVLYFLFQTSPSRLRVKRKLPLSSAIVSRSRASASIIGTRSLDTLKRKLQNSAPVCNKMNNKFKSLKMLMSHTYIIYLFGRKMRRKTQNQLCHFGLKIVEVRSSLRSCKKRKLQSLCHLLLHLCPHKLRSKLKGSRVVGKVKHLLLR